jgi:hypothetical protein
MKRLLCELLAFGMLVGGVAEAKGQPGYRYTLLSAPGRDLTLPRGINNSGQIVGSSWDSGGSWLPRMIVGSRT